MTPRALWVLAISFVFAMLPVSAAALIKSSTLLTSSTDLSTFGQAVTLTAALSSTLATGRVTFYDGTTPIGTGALGAVTTGQATLAVRLPAGSHILKAYYPGDGNFAPSLSPTINEVVFAFPEKGFVGGASLGNGSNTTFAATGDINGDGKADLIVAVGGTNSVQVLLGGGDGTFQSGLSYTTGSFPDSVAIGDFNGDGLPDIAVSNRDSGTVSVLIAVAGGTFLPAVSYTTFGTPYAIVTTDLNGDGKADLMVAGNGIFSVLLGNGDGTFPTAVNYAVSTSFFRAIAVGDFNGDGIPDVVLANINGASVSVVLGIGDGTFHTSTNYSVGTTPISIAVADFNGDGVADLAVANYDSNTVSVLLGKGDGTFQAAVTHAVGAKPYSVGVGDFNGDGKPDLVVTNSVSSFISVLPGNGDGTFAATANYTVATDLVSVAVGEFNGDGVSDLALLVGNGGGQILLGIPATLATRPVINAAGIVTGANYVTQLSGGVIGTIFGTNLAPAIGTATAVPLPVELNGVSVSVSGYLAPLFYVSPTQINFQLPWELLGQNSGVAVVAVNGSLSATQTVTLRSLSPGVFSLDSSGTGEGAVQIANTSTYAQPIGDGRGSLAQPVARGQYVTIYCSGLGDVKNRPVTGAPALPDPLLSNTLGSVTATIGGVDAPVSFAGLSPGFVGLYQVNALVQGGVPSGNSVRVVVSIGGLPSNTVTIAVQ